MKVVISGIFYPFTMMHYFIRAFKRRDDVELYTVGPFTGDWIPWNGGMRIPYKYVYTPDTILPKNFISQQVKSRLVESFLPWKPDLWLQIDAGWHLADRPDAGIVAHIQTDPHVLKYQYQRPKAYSDYVFCMQTPYMQEGEWFLPYAYDPTIHYPEPREKIHDACLVGLLYDHRQKLITGLRNKGLDVHYSIGQIYDEYREIYNQSKVAISWSSLQDTPARVWESMAMGIPTVCNVTPDMPTFFVEGEHYLGFEDVSDAIDKVLLLLSDEDFREEIGEAGRRKVKPHTWDLRVQQVLETVKLL